MLGRCALAARREATGWRGSRRLLAPVNKAILENLNLLPEAQGDTVLVGLTATPFRGDGLGLKDAQSVGRGLRPHPGKQDCRLIDLGDTDHDLCHVGMLAGLSREEIRDGEPVSRTKRWAGERYPAEEPDLDQAVKVVARPLDVLGRSMFVWKTLSRDRLALQASPAERILVLPEGEDRFRMLLRVRGGGERVLGERLPLGYTQGVAEDYVREHRLEGFAARDAAWRGRSATRRQAELLREFGVEEPERMTRGEAADMMQRSSGGVGESKWCGNRRCTVLMTP